jgi:hypothetical protein
MKGVFDTIEKNQLTPEQRLVVVTDEEATLVLAGPGSGKTSSPTPFRAPINCQAIYNPSRGLCVKRSRSCHACAMPGVRLNGRFFRCTAQAIRASLFASATALRIVTDWTLPCRDGSVISSLSRRSEPIARVGVFTAHSAGAI